MSEIPQSSDSEYAKVRIERELENKFTSASLSSAEVQPLQTFTSDEITAFRNKLSAEGYNFESLENEHIESLKESQFRNNLTEGRGPGMVAVLGSEEKVMELRKWCHETSLGWKRLKKGGEVVEGSEGRGLQQLAADLILIATGKLGDTELTEVFTKINRRIAKGYIQASKSEEETRVIKERFGIFDDIPSTVASVPPEKTLDLYNFLTH